MLTAICISWLIIAAIIGMVVMPGHVLVDNDRGFILLTKYLERGIK